MQLNYLCCFKLIFFSKSKWGYCSLSVSFNGHSEMLLILESLLHYGKGSMFIQILLNIELLPEWKEKCSPQKAENKSVPKGWWWTWPQTFGRHMPFWGHPFGDKYSMYWFLLYSDAIQDTVACYDKYKCLLLKLFTKHRI